MCLMSTYEDSHHFFLSVPIKGTFLFTRNSLEVISVKQFCCGSPSRDPSIIVQALGNVQVQYPICILNYNFIRYEKHMKLYRNMNNFNDQLSRLLNLRFFFFREISWLYVCPFRMFSYICTYYVFLYFVKPVPNIFSYKNIIFKNIKATR